MEDGIIAVSDQKAFEADFLSVHGPGEKIPPQWRGLVSVDEETKRVTWWWMCCDCCAQIHVPHGKCPCVGVGWSHNC